MHDSKSFVLNVTQLLSSQLVPGYLGFLTLGNLHSQRMATGYTIKHFIV